MKSQRTMQASQLEELALFIEEHPGFSPELKGDDAFICGFRVGKCFLTLTRMRRLVATRPHFNAGETALLLASSERVRADGMTLGDRVDQVLARAARKASEARSRQGFL